MGVEIWGGPKSAHFYCNTADVAFGPIFVVPNGVLHIFDGAIEYVEQFERWLPNDPRMYDNDQLRDLEAKFVNDCKVQALGLQLESGDQ